MEHSKATYKTSLRYSGMERFCLFFRKNQWPGFPTPPGSQPRMPPPSSACIPFPAAPIISQFEHVQRLNRQKGRFQKNLGKIHTTDAEKHKPAHPQGQCRDSPCDPHELAPQARLLLQCHTELTGQYPSPSAPATVHDSTARWVSVRAGIFATQLSIPLAVGA